MICLIIPENLGYLVLFLLVRKSVHNFHGTSVLTSHQLTHGFLLKSSWNPLLIGPKALIVPWFHQFLQISFEFLQDYHKKKVSPILRVLPHKKKNKLGKVAPPFWSWHPHPQRVPGSSPPGDWVPWVPWVPRAWIRENSSPYTSINIRMYIYTYIYNYINI
jgi:hypothetical protein